MKNPVNSPRRIPCIRAAALGLSISMSVLLGSAPHGLTVSRNLAINRAPITRADRDLVEGGLATAPPVRFFDGQLITGNLISSIVGAPVLAWGPGEDVDAQGNIVTKNGELWFLTPSGRTLDFYVLSEEPCASENSPVFFSGYTILAMMKVSVAAVDNPEAVATTIVTKEWWLNSKTLGINHAFQSFNNHASGSAILNAAAQSQARTRYSATAGAAFTANRGPSSGNLPLAPSSGMTSAPLYAAGGSFTASPSMPVGTGAAAQPAQGGAGTGMIAIHEIATLEFVGTLIETTAYSSGSDYSIDVDAYDLNGDLFSSFRQMVIASSGVTQISQEAQACKELGQDVQKGLEIWTDVTTLGATVLGGLAGVAAEFLTAGGATPVIGGLSVLYMGGVGAMNILHKNLTAPLIGGLVESHCMGNIVQNVSLAEFLVTPDSLDFSNMEPVLVCDEWVTIETVDSNGQNVEPADDAAYEVVVTGEISQETGCNIWHYEWREVQ